MAHYAEIDESGTVTRVVVVPDEYEHDGAWYLAVVLGLGGHWLQTSYNGRMRKNFAGIGHVYDAVRDAFVPPPPFASWYLDEDLCRWQPPVPMPGDGGRYCWDEAVQAWLPVPEDG